MGDAVLGQLRLLQPTRSEGSAWIMRRSFLEMGFGIRGRRCRVRVVRGFGRRSEASGFNLLSLLSLSRKSLAQQSSCPVKAILSRLACYNDPPNLKSRQLDLSSSHLLGNKTLA